jgi:hypothetical protein
MLRLDAPAVPTGRKKEVGNMDIQQIRSKVELIQAKVRLLEKALDDNDQKAVGATIWELKNELAKLYKMVGSGSAPAR